MKIDKVTKMIEQPEVWLCHRDYTNQGKICSISPIEDLKIYVTANAVDEVSFTFHKNNNGVDFQYWDQIKDLKVICVDGFGYFEIAVDKEVSNDTKKVITGVSMEAELAQITIDSLEINGEVDRNNDDNWDNYGEYIPTTICDTSDTKHSLLHRLLSKAPHWKVGYTTDFITINDVQASTSTVYRTFNFSNTNIYDALQEIAKEVDVVFTFNTVTRAVNMYDLNDIGEDTTVYVSTQNLASDFTCSSNKDSIKNCFKVVGGDDLINNAVRAVNPNGSNYIYYMSPDQMEDMSDGLKAKLQKYDELYEQYKDEYAEVCGLLYDAIDKVYELETGMFPTHSTPGETTASEQIANLTASNIGNIPVESLTNLYETGAERAVKTVVQLMVDFRYEVSLESSSYDATTHTWTGKFKVENASDTTDSAISASDVVLTFVEDEKSSLQSKIDELLGDVDINDDDDIETFKENLKNYSRDYLATYASIYKECSDTLIQYSYKSKVPNEIPQEMYDFYHSYWEKWQACQAELDVRNAEIEAAKVKQAHYEGSVEVYHEMLDFEFHMGDYYKEFCLYRREDTYQNDNYISDGMNNSELLQNAQKLVEVATKELYKASLFQTVYTANLNNLFTNPIYEPFYDKFDLFNWIHAEIDDKQVMLRLIGITYDFSSMEKIEVEFSDQVRNGNGISDIESILNQSKSMATSYSSTLKQAQNGQEACLEFDTLKQEGLNSALMNIKNSNNEEVVIDNCGINCRSKDQNDQYDQHELRITGKNIVMTDDSYESCRMALGLMTLEYDSDGDGIPEKHEEYGLVADCIIGDLIVGQTLLIANSSGTFLVDKDGIIVKNMKLDMSNEDGTRRIVIDPELDSILSIYTNSKQVFYVDAYGNMCMLGNLYVNNNGMYLKVDMTSENIIEVGYGEITGTGNEGESGSGSGGVNTGNYVEQTWEQVDYGQDIYNGTVPIIRGGIQSNENTLYHFNYATLFSQYHFINYGGEIYHLAYGGYLIKYNEKKKTWNLITQITNNKANNPTYSSFVKTNKEDGNIYIFYVGNSSAWAVLYKYNLNDDLLSEVWTSGVNNYLTPYHPSYSRHYIKDDIFYISVSIADYNYNINAPLKVTLNSDRSYKVGEYSQWAPQYTKIHEIMPYNNDEYGVISIGQSKVMLVKFKNIDSFTYDTLYTFDYSISSYLRTGGIIADVFKDKIIIVFKNMNIHYEYDIKSDMMNTINTFKLGVCGTAEQPAYSSEVTLVPGFSMIASKDKLHMFAIGANQCYGGGRDWVNTSYSYYVLYFYRLQDLSYIPQYYIRHYEYLDEGKLETNKNFEKLSSGYNFYMSRQCSFTKIGDTIYNIPTFWGMLTGWTDNGSKTANYTSWNVPIYALDTTNKDNDFQIICSSIGVPIVSVINSNSTSKIYFFAGTDATYLQYYDLETKTVGSVFTDEDGNRVASAQGWHEFSYLDETEQILYEMGTSFVRLDLATNTVLEKISLGISVHSNVEVIKDEFYFVSLMSDRSKTKLYKLTKSGVLSTVATMQESEDIGSNMGYSIAYYNNKIHMYYAVNGVLKRKRYEYSFETGEVTSYTDMFQDNGMYVYDSGLGSNSTCHLPAITTSTGIHYFTGTTYDFNNKFTNPFNHYVYKEVSADTPTDPDDPTKPPSVDNPTDKIFYITNQGDGYFYGTVYAKDGVFSGDIIARSLTLGENAVVKGNISANTGNIGGWKIGTDCLKSVKFDDTATTTNGICLDSSGEIRSKGSYYSSLDDSGVEGWFARLYSGKWIFGYYDSSQSDPFVPPTGTPYSDISVNGIYICSKSTILNNISNRYLFRADAENDVVSITSNSETKSGLYVTNDGGGACLEVKNNAYTYDNKALSLGVTVLNTDGNREMGYITIFGEGEGGNGRIIMRPDQNYKSDAENPMTYTNSACGTKLYPWGEMGCNKLYVDETSTTSDAKLKTPIKIIDSDIALEFINGLIPREYRFKDGKRLHMGFYAQEVCQLAKDLNLGDMAIYEAMMTKDGDENEHYYDENADDKHLHWSLKYNEFIAPMVSAIQGLSKENEELKSEVSEMKSMIQQLVDRIEKLEETK